MTAVVLRGDARSLPLPDASVDLIVTSPPYFGLRDYRDQGGSLTGQIGSEVTPQEWLEALWECTAEWMRALKPEGSLFVNLGDSYYSAKGNPGPNGHDPKQRARRGWQRPVDQSGLGYPRKSLLGLPWRYAIGCTDRLGLILRRDIIWHKPNALPESVADRAKSSHEYLFHFVKQPRYYAALDEIREGYAPGTAKRYAAGYSARAIDGKRLGVNVKLGGDTYSENPLGKVPGSVWIWTISSAPLITPRYVAVGGPKLEWLMSDADAWRWARRAGVSSSLLPRDDTRRELRAAPDHFAAMPPELARQVILGWSPPGVCTACGQGRRPVSQAAPAAPKGWAAAQREGRSWHGDGADLKRALGVAAADRNRRITGYVCECTPYTDHPGVKGRARDGQGYARETGRDAHPHGGVGVLPRTGPWREYHFDRWTPPPTRPAIVLDPFAGTGTTMLVAAALGRIGIGTDLSMDYARLAQWRTADPGERARALDVPKPPKQVDGQEPMFDLSEEVS